MNRPKHIQRGHRIPVRLTGRDRELIRNHTFVGGDLERRIRVAPIDGRAAAVGLTLDELDELIGHVAAEANHARDPKLRQQLDRLWNLLRAIEDGHTDEEVRATSHQTSAPAKPSYTTKQGQYLAFIWYYAKIHGQSPSEAEMQRYFKISAPAVHQMILTLEARGLIERVPGKARSLRLLVQREEVPNLE